MDSSSPSDQLPEQLGAADEIAQDMPRSSLSSTYTRLLETWAHSCRSRSWVCGVRHACRRADNQVVGTMGRAGQNGTGIPVSDDQPTSRRVERPMCRRLEGRDTQSEPPWPWPCLVLGDNLEVRHPRNRGAAHDDRG